MKNLNALPQIQDHPALVAFDLNPQLNQPVRNNQIMLL